MMEFRNNCRELINPGRKNDMTKRKNQATYFSQIADIYDGQQPLLVRKYSEKHNLMVQMIQFEKPFSVVDLGCGTGALAHKILQAYPSATVTCVDISPEMISIAQRKLAKFEGHTEFIVEDLEKIKFQKSYEVAVSIDAIHHLPHAQKRDLFGRLYNALTIIRVVKAPALKRGDETTHKFFRVNP
jgi:tRNA (cmo5U34)-methyltransferase